MSIYPKNKELENVEEAINNFIQCQDDEDKGIALKLDYLDRMIEILRVRNKCIKNKIPFEVFLGREVFADNDKLFFSLSKNSVDTGKGITPVELQPKLLQFLLINHRQSYRVMDILDHFIDKVWNYMSVIDFKRTETGVYRCYTNTRFAANVLRDYGLLKFTHKEAYKTWVLSLPGFLVASIVLERSQSWGLNKNELSFGGNLHSEIREAWDKVKTFESFEQRLSYLCRPNIDLFSSFSGVLNKAYCLLEKYWQVLRDSTITQKNRQEESIKLINELEEMKDIENFYYEFAKCLDLERLLKDIQQPTQN